MPHYLFVTGRLAEQPLRRLLETLAPQVGFEYSVAVMPITIAALITPRWLAKRLEVPEGVSTVVVPGHCAGDLSPVEEIAKVRVERGPRDLRELPAFYERERDVSQSGAWDIDIVARIANADGQSIDEVLDLASSLAEDGADVFVLSGSGRPWPELSALVRELRAEFHRVAIENVTPVDILAAASHEIELILPADVEQQEAAAGLGWEVVVPVGGSTLDEIATTADSLSKEGVPYRLDLGLRPIGLGLAESVARYVTFRRQWPNTPLTMFLEEVTATAAVDSAPIHVLLVGLCQELRVNSVIVSGARNWNQSAVQECHLARQLTYSAKQTMSPLGDAEPGLLMLRDAAVLEFGREEIDRLAEILKDPSPRFYAEGGRLHAVSDGKHLESNDPYDLFDQIVSNTDRKFDASQAFYLGYEMAKAVTALTLGKTYLQDEALDWGMLTQRELTRLERRALRMARLRDGECEETQQYYAEDDLDDEFEGSIE